MRIHSVHLLAALVAMILIPRAHYAQQSPNPIPGPAEVPAKEEYTVWAGRSFGYPQIISGLTDQRLFIAGIRFGRRFLGGSNTSLWGNWDVVPVVVLSQPDPPGRRYTYGGGSFIGLQGYFAGRWPIQPFFDPSIGFLAFKREIPVPNSRRFNLSFKFGTGFLVPVRPRRAIKIGFWVHHFSNAGTAPHNPGVDGFIVYLGYSFFR